MGISGCQCSSQPLDILGKLKREPLATSQFDWATGTASTTIDSIRHTTAKLYPESTGEKSRVFADFELDDGSTHTTLVSTIWWNVCLQWSGGDGANPCFRQLKVKKKPASKVPRAKYCGPRARAQAALTALANKDIEVGGSSNFGMLCDINGFPCSGARFLGPRGVT